MPARDEAASLPSTAPALANVFRHIQVSSLDSELMARARLNYHLTLLSSRHSQTKIYPMIIGIFFFNSSTVMFFYLLIVMLGWVINVHILPKLY